MKIEIQKQSKCPHCGKDILLTYRREEYSGSSLEVGKPMEKPEKKSTPMRAGTYNKLVRNGFTNLVMCFLGCYSGLQYCSKQRDDGKCMKTGYCMFQECPYRDDDVITVIK